MKTQTNLLKGRARRTNRIVNLFLLAFAGPALLVVSCRPKLEFHSTTPVTATAQIADPLMIVLAPQPGDTARDKEIARVQQQVRDGKNKPLALEQLGWLFIAKARIGFDPGFYKLAEQCGLAIGSLEPHSPEALLLRGYALQNLHHFKEAEPLVRELVARRGRAFDYGLLGDILMEQGRLGEAVIAYQQMADLKPDLQAYTRAAHMRWLKGDLDGAIEVMQMAVQAASPRDAESAAWVNTRMALYQLQAGQFEKCRQHCEAALEFQKNYPPALLAKGRLLLAKNKFADALEPLRLAVKFNPLPEYQWALAEALRAAGQPDEAGATENQMKAQGMTADPRTYALFLATSGEDVLAAVQLARAELETRGDVLTHDVLARSLAAAGRWADAGAEMKLALAEGTQDARLFLHAGIVAAKLSRTADAEKFLGQAAGIQQMLLPSEREQLKNVSATLSPQQANSNQNKNKKERS